MFWVGITDFTKLSFPFLRENNFDVWAMELFPSISSTEMYPLDFCLEKLDINTFTSSVAWVYDSLRFVRTVKSRKDAFLGLAYKRTSRSTPLRRQKS
ncbi:MAG: Uncharacterised protein [Flavobacteriaceae bacterium]|nr:MAG: Uncharacterised protein [Flavobacteriaceae bacterium]